MANIIRCLLPDGVHRFKPFTVEDYRDFLLVRNDIQHRTIEEQHTILDELLEEYFPEYTKTWRPFIFLHVFSGSIGKTKVPISFSCSKCKSKKATQFNIYQKELKMPEVETAGVKIKFNFPDKEYEDKALMISENINSVFYQDQWVPWKEISEESRLLLIDAIDIATFEDIIEQMRPINLTLRMKCCEDHSLAYTDILDVFKLLVAPDEIFTFYQVNHLLIKNHYDLSSVMRMIPVERGIALSLIEKDNKK